MQGYCTISFLMRDLTFRVNSSIPLTESPRWNSASVSGIPFMFIEVASVINLSEGSRVRCKFVYDYQFTLLPLQWYSSNWNGHVTCWCCSLRASVFIFMSMFLFAPLFIFMSLFSSCFHSHSGLWLSKSVMAEHEHEKLWCKIICNIQRTNFRAKIHAQC